jgi:hypothetical protein
LSQDTAGLKLRNMVITAVAVPLTSVGWQQQSGLPSKLTMPLVDY